MNFVIAFLGIIIYTMMLYRERYLSKENDRRFDKERKIKNLIYNDWKSNVTDLELENKFKSEIIVDEFKVFSIVSPVICSINGFPDEFNGCDEFFSYMRSFPGMIARTYMGIHNKLLCSDAENGIRSPDIYNSELRHRWKMNHEFMKWLNSQIISSDNRFELKFIKGDKIDIADYNDKYLLNLNDIILDRCIGGKYCWAINTNIITVF